MSGLTSLPVFQYQEFKPLLNKDARTTQVRFYPQGFQNFGTGVSSNNYVKFNFQTTGFWDPKSCYIHLDVQPITKNTGNTGTLFQVDNSGSSIFSQLIIRHNGVELERCNDYDSLAAMMFDMNVGTGAREYQDLQGLGKWRDTFPNTQALTSGMTGTSITNQWADTAGTPPQWWSNFITGASQAMGGYSTGLTISPWRPQLNIQPWAHNTLLRTNPWVPSNGGIGLSDYLLSFINNGGEGVQHAVLSTPGAQTEFYSYFGMWNGQVADFGYTKPYSDCSVGCMEPWFGSQQNIPRLTVSSGLPCYKAPQAMSFALPLLSPIFGPNATHGKLLPMRKFQGLEFEFLVSPYAFTAYKYNNNFLQTDASYTGALSNTNSSQTIVNMQSANRTGWVITRFEIIVEIINLSEPDEMEISNRIESGGFNLPFETWYLCNKQKLTNGDQLNGTFQINQAFDSLKMMTIRSNPADFEIYPYCRKHTYLSMNITSLQMRIGTEFIPSNPINGHTGNIRMDFDSGSVKLNYVDFFIQTMKAWGKFFDMADSSLLNPTNFCYNSTPFDPTLTLPNTLAFGVDSFQGADTLYNMALFSNNRAVGRCILSIDTERFDILGNVRSGASTLQNRPFDILIEADTGSVNLKTGQIAEDARFGAAPFKTVGCSFPRPFYISFWAFYDATLTYSNGEWKTLGRY